MLHSNRGGRLVLPLIARSPRPVEIPSGSHQCGIRIAIDRRAKNLGFTFSITNTCLKCLQTVGTKVTYSYMEVLGQYNINPVPMILMQV